MRNLLLLPLTLLLFSCTKTVTVNKAVKDQPLISYVNPFIGTDGHGHTYPGAVAPFGMMQLSPDTRLEGWDGCSGYHYSDKHIYGFSHTHLSGTGVSDYADVLLMPTNTITFNNGADGEKGYRSTFSHEDENASPGFYEVLLKDTDIKVSLTVSRRSGMHKYEFPSAENQIVILDLEHRDKLNDVKLNILSDTEISGYRFSKAWATNQKLFFNIQFSKPFKVEDTLMSSTFKTSTKAALKFHNPKNEPIYVKVGISAVDEQGAKLNLEKEIGTKTFNEVKSEIEKLWKKQLEKITIEDRVEDKKVIFYTSLYHSMLAPHLHQDVDMRYRGMNDSIYKAEDFEQYTVFSLWDTFRATHPLFTLIEQKRTAAFIRTFLRQFKEGGQLPIWELAANYTGCMIGYHAIPVIADAYAKGIRDFDADLALEAMVHSAMQDDLGLKSFKENGFISASDEPESVSKTLEYAYDDWCIALMAEQLGAKKTAAEFYQRGQNYKNLYDPSSRFFRAKRSYAWFSPFKAEEVNFNYTEANAWQYSLFAPQDIGGHIELMGGPSNYEAHLDEMFSASTVTSGREQADITGLIGQYAHGNEPSHHMAYLYNYVGKPYKTQEKVRQILEEQYSNLPDGLSGNEDCGQMSAWYVLSAMGFYSVTPGLDYYTIGTPLFEKATLNLENGNTFVINTKNVSDKNIYIQAATLNGEMFNQSFIEHQSIMEGGKLVFEMGSKPSDWGSGSIPPSKIERNRIIPVPYFVAESQTFAEKMTIKLGSAIGGDIYYAINGEQEIKYENPILIDEDAEIKCRTIKDDKWSKSISANYYKIDNKKSIVLHSDYANQYAAAGDKTLIDHQRGGTNYRTGNWQGYRENFEAVIDLGEVRAIKSIGLGCLQDIRSWIFYPKQVEYFTSINGETFTYLGIVNTTFSDTLEGSFVQDYTLQLKNTKAKYLKVKAKNYGICPAWHLGAGGKTWLFIDELIIE